MRIITCSIFICSLILTRLPGSPEGGRRIYDALATLLEEKGNCRKRTWGESFLE
jgi:hypothetical protein